MLVLTRKSSESVIVGGGASPQRELKVTVLEVQGDRVRLGIEAHRDLRVLRWEVWERIRQEAKLPADRPPLQSATKSSFTLGLSDLDRAQEHAESLELREEVASDV